MIKWFKSPRREYVSIGLLSVAFFVDFVFLNNHNILLVVALIASWPTFFEALHSLYKRNITIDTFNAFVLLVSLWAGEIRSAAFIALMLVSASWLEKRTEDKSKRSIEALLRLRPERAMVERDGTMSEISIKEAKMGDILVVKEGSLIPLDGVVVSGSASVNEAAVTGESVPKDKHVGFNVLAGTVVEVGHIKIKVRKMGGESTIEKMARLITEAHAHKSDPEKLADKFAAIFLPVVILIAGATYFFTRDLVITSALFLVACADDLAVAIPLAVTAALGQAAKMGVIVKGGQWLAKLAEAKVVILDKTGTLTHGTFSVSALNIFDKNFDEEKIWEYIAVAEKYVEHPIARALIKEAKKRGVADPRDADSVSVVKGGGVVAKYDGRQIALGDEDMLSREAPNEAKKGKELLAEARSRGAVPILIIIEHEIVAVVEIADTPRVEAKKAIEALRELGIEEIWMLTGDEKNTAQRVGAALGLEVQKIKFSLLPEDKLTILADLQKKGGVIMVGDGINDAPALARADVSIAMGEGAAVAIETADAVILHDNLMRLPEVISLSRRTTHVVHTDIAMWGITNAIGFLFVFTRVFSPAFAAAYNFLTDFIPLINSARLFRK